MAAARSRRLTLTHKALQARIGKRTAVRLLGVWPLLDPDDLDGSARVWLAAALPVVAGQYRASAAVAADYMQAFRQAEVGDLGPIVAPSPINPAALSTSLAVTGPVSVKRAMTRGVGIEDAMRTARAASTAAGMRHALAGGRETVTATIRQDEQAVGYRRVTSTGACDYCAGLTGITFDGDATFRAHDGCGCHAEPVYR